MAVGLSLLLIAAAIQADRSAHIISEEEGPDLGTPLSGADFLLIQTASRHQALRGANLSCYRIYVFVHNGVREVAFLEARNRLLERETDEGTEITFLESDPDCRSISFQMDENGRVARVIHSSH